MKCEFKDGALTFYLEGRISSSNVAEFETNIKDERSMFGPMPVAFDAAGLEYISSAGLRVFLKLRKETKSPVRMFNVSDEVFDILEVTGFVDILEVERAMRHISLTGCKKISSALNGEIFQLSEDEMIKVFGNTVPLSEIKKERATAKTALICGIPTLIPYDVVSCEQGHGIVFEKAEMTSLSYMISHDPTKMPHYAKELARLLKELHTTSIPEGKLPDIKDRYRQWIEELGDDRDVNADVFAKLIASIADADNYVHGDINLNSVMIKDGELLLLDMAGSAHGHRLFDLQSLFASLVVMEKSDEGYCRRTFGISSVECLKFWKIFFGEYMDNREQEIASTNELLLKYSVLKQRVLTKVEMKHRLGKVAG